MGIAVREGVFRVVAKRFRARAARTMIRLRAIDHAEVAAAAFNRGEQRAMASAYVRAAAHPHKQIARDARALRPLQTRSGPE